MTPVLYNTNCKVKQGTWTGILSLQAQDKKPFNGLLCFAHKGCLFVRKIILIDCFLTLVCTVDNVSCHVHYDVAPF